MKFLQLDVGQRFEWNGEVYSKSSPILAVAEASGKSRMVPRSSAVTPLGDGNAVTAQVAEPSDIPLSTAREALQQMQQDLLSYFEELASGDDAIDWQAVQDRLQQARESAEKSLIK